MKSLDAIGASRMGRILLAAALLNFSIGQGRALLVDDPGLRLTLRVVDQNAVVSWPGANAVPYQLETSSDLTSWTDMGPATTGSGALLSVTNPISGQSRFYRVKRLIPANQNSAVFDPATGLLTVVGDDSDNQIVVGPNGGPIFVTIGGNPIVIAGGVATVANTVLIQVFGLAGNDQITIVNGLPPVHLFGGDGNDTLIGGNTADLLVGGPGSDTLRGQGGADQLFGEDGDDVFVWNPGENSDLIEGGNGLDTLVFNGANIAEIIDLSAIGSRARLTRNIATVTEDMDGVERIDVTALSGADNVVVNNLAGTAVAQVNVNFAMPGGGGDASTDVVTFTGTTGSDIINISADGNAVVATGVGAEVRVVGGEVNLDRLSIVGVGNDLVNVNGSAAADLMQVLPSTIAGHIDVFVSGYSTLVDVSGALTLSVNGLGDADTIAGFNGVASLNIPVRLDGGEGNDTITGSDAGDLIIGGPGKDTIGGNRGSDTVFMGDDDDTYLWNPGDGNDVVEGEAGADTIVFSGSNIGEIIELSAIGPRFRLTRNIGSVVLDADGVERVDSRALSGADNFIVNSLAGTAVTKLNLDLGITGDSQADVISISGLPTSETFDIAVDADGVVINNAAVEVHVLHAEPTFDRLIINCVGNDFVNVNGSAAGDTMAIEPNGIYAKVTATGYPVSIEASGALTLAVNALGGTDTIAGIGNLAALGIPLRMDGGEGDDAIYGSNGEDVLLGGPGNDVIDGNVGNDVVILGDGDDTFYSDPGDGDDIVEGGVGADTVVFNSSSLSENIDFTADGPRLHLFRNSDNITLDIAGVERVDCNALGGADNVVINSLAGTPIAEVNIDLAGTLGGTTGDAQPDVVTVNGTAGPDTINVSANGGTVAVFGLSTLVWISHPEAANDALIVNGLGGTDTLIPGPGVNGAIALTLNQN